MASIETKGMSSRFESKRGLWLVVWGLVVLLGVALVGLAFYAESDQVGLNPCRIGLGQYLQCYSYPYAAYWFPLLGAGLLVILWSSAYLITIMGSRNP